MSEPKTRHGLKHRDDSPNARRDWKPGTGIGAGIAIGVGVGVALGNPAIGIGVGLAIGAALEKSIRE